MEGVRYPDVLYGTLLSLYDVCTILVLENAVLHCNLRIFFPSLAILDSFEALIFSKPTTVLEHS